MQYELGDVFALTQPVTIAVHSGGGACVDPPSAGFGQITWQKTVSTDSSNAASETDTVIGSLQASPGQQPPAYEVSGFGPPSLAVLPGPACAVPGYRSLGAGSVTVQGPGLSARQVPLSSYLPGQVSGLSAYQVTLPTGTIQAGDFTVTATGGADVGAFQVPLKIGADIQIQTPLAGQTFSMCGGIPFSWTGGDPAAWVTAGVLAQGGPPYPAFGPAFFDFSGQQARVSDGSMIVGFGGISDTSTCTTGGQPVLVYIEVDPDPSEVTTFSAPGLSLGGRAVWRYVHTFEANLVHASP